MMEQAQRAHDHSRAVALQSSAAPAPSILFLAWLATSMLGCATELEREQMTTAAPIAEHWVQALDAGDRDALSKATSSLNKLRFDHDDQLRLGSRQPLGQLVNRKLELSWSRDPEFLDGVPDGTYWEVSFQYEFEHKREVFEELLLHWEDGEWRILSMRFK